MYVARVPNRTSPPAFLLREGYRENGKVKTRTLANLSHWPAAKIERLTAGCCAPIEDFFSGLWVQHIDSNCRAGVVNVTMNQFQSVGR